MNPTTIKIFRLDEQLALAKTIQAFCDGDADGPLGPYEDDYPAIVEAAERLAELVLKMRRRTP